MPQPVGLSSLHPTALVGKGDYLEQPAISTKPPRAELPASGISWRHGLLFGVALGGVYLGMLQQVSQRPKASG